MDCVDFVRVDRLYVVRLLAGAPTRQHQRANSAVLGFSAALLSLGSFLEQVHDMISSDR